jgi:hypothetical protein
MEIDSAAPVHSRRELVIAASPASIWSILSDFNAWPRWNPAIQAIQFDGPLAPGSTFRWKSGGLSIVSNAE